MRDMEIQNEFIGMDDRLTILEARCEKLEAAIKKLELSDADPGLKDRIEALDENAAAGVEFF